MRWCVVQWEVCVVLKRNSLCFDAAAKDCLSKTITFSIILTCFLNKLMDALRKTITFSYDISKIKILD